MARQRKAPKTEAPAVPPAQPAPEAGTAAAPPPATVEVQPEPVAPAPSLAAPPDSDEVMEARHWRRSGWAARVIKNEDDEGWSVEVSRDDIPEPVLVSPWVMGRDKKNPKPFDAGAFATFVKTASEVLRRSAQQREAELRKSLHLAWNGTWYKIVVVVVPDEYEPYATLTASTEEGELASYRVDCGYRLTQERALAWIRDGFPAPQAG